jgi:DNA gyrase subunit B
VSEYTSKDIQKLSDSEHCRLRLDMYFGQTSPGSFPILSLDDDGCNIEEVEFVPATLKSIIEITDNCIDELTQSNVPNKRVDIKCNPETGEYDIKDNGRGVPIDKHDTGDYTPQIVFGEFRSGRNFKEGKEQGVRGRNGIGSSATNFCSEQFKVVIHRDGKRYTQTFKEGGTKKTKPSIIAKDSGSGTQLKFKLDPQVFKDVSLPPSLVDNWAKDIAYTNPGVSVSLNKSRYKFKNGFEDTLKRMCSKTGGTLTTLTTSTPKATMKVHVVTGVDVDTDNYIFCYVNSGYLFNGGVCNTQINNAFHTQIQNGLAARCKKEKCKVEKQDINHNVLIIADIKVSDPEFDAQSKLRLTGPNLRLEINKMFEDAWTMFNRKNKAWLEEVFQRSYDRHHAHSNTSAIKNAQKNLKRKIATLTDCSSKNREDCSILITEGLSAAASITEVRDPATIATFALTGKINNVYGCKAHELTKMGKLTDLMTSIGLIPGVKADPNNLRYGRIVIATDADPDGSSIFNLLINLFYSQWPELFAINDPMIYRLIAPNVVAEKGNKRLYYPNKQEYDAAKGKLKGYDISYLKGLGGLTKDMWDAVLNDERNYLPIWDDGEMGTILKLLFDNDAEKRKVWLTNDTP